MSGWEDGPILVFSPWLFYLCLQKRLFLARHGPQNKEGRDEHMREMVLMGNDTLAAMQLVAHRPLQQAGTQAESNASWHGTCERERTV